METPTHGHSCNWLCRPSFQESCSLLKAPNLTDGRDDESEASQGSYCTPCA